MEVVKSTKVIIPYKPRELQLEFHSNIHRWNLLVCHRRFGKTVCAINQLIKSAVTCKLERPRFAYIAPFYKQAKRIAWDYAKHFSRPIPNIKINESELRIDYPNGARLELLGADNPDNIRGVYLDGVVLDEYGDMSPRLFTEVVRPALSDRKGWALFIGSAKGGTIFHELYEDVANDPEWLVRVYKASETGIIDEEELRSARNQMTADEYAQEYECSWNSSIRGAYYAKELEEADSEGRICRVPYEKQLEVHTYWDIGVSDATAIWFVQAAGKEIRFIDYYEAEGEGLPHFAQVLKEKGYVYGKFWGPHDIRVREFSSGRSRVEAARSLGINFDVVSNDSILNGINAARLIFNQCWFDQDKCKLGIQALRNYRKEYNEKKREFSKSPLHDWSSHACLTGDTLVRCVDGEKRIDQVQVGDKVSLGHTFGNVSASGLVKHESVLVIEMSNGQKIEATRNHKFLTKRGLVYADALQCNDQLLTERDIPCSTILGKMGVRKFLSMNAKYLRERDSTKGQITGIFTQNIQNTFLCIGMFGRIITGRYLKECTYTIKTMIDQTIGSKTLSLCVQVPTQSTTAQPISGLARKLININWQRLPIKPRFGMHRKRAENGIVSTLKRHGKTESLSRKIAFFVKKSMRRTTRIDRSFATITVSKITEGGKKPVFDLTVDHHHAYIANGVLVSNSDAFRYFAVNWKVRQDKKRLLKPKVNIA